MLEGQKLGDIAIIPPDRNFISSQSQGHVG